MITSRPQTTNLISFILFLVIAYALITINFLTILHDPAPLWFNYLIVIVLVPIAIFTTHKILFRYKIVQMGNSQIDIRHPLFGTHQKHPLQEVEYWTESLVKTGKTSTYKELEIRFTDGKKITMAYREYTEYDKMIGYLRWKIPKKLKAL